MRAKPRTSAHDHIQTLTDLKQRLQSLARPRHAELQLRFFKTGPGEYGEGDRFLGLDVPTQRALAREFRHLPLDAAKVLLLSPWHEERLVALLLMIGHYEKAAPKEREALTEFYLSHARYVNNWDLVDASAHLLAGPTFPATRTKRLETLARSGMLWERRIAVVATFHHIRQNQFEPTLRISDILLHDTHDLIHKAVGWMLREVGKRDLAVLEEFLKPRYAKMPRTMLRYAIERFPEKRRQAYLKGKIGALQP
ncbi:MAG TPA: DNA alkylation repair protein [Candidatus Ozemobacteraceae bacterium]|nr:DNA alkylation repair protein [Candidatus Ozemobacteraceae bacterium]